MALEELDQLEAPAAAGLSNKLRAGAPPIAALSIALLITLAILPSSLNLPQSQPSTVLEYAPIPPEDDSPPPFSGGGLSSLGLAGSSSLTSGAVKPPTPPLTKRKLPPIQQQKRCVKGRQTEDPNSPPCQSFFDGENFGNTWQGVTGDEITVLYYMAAGRILDQGAGTVQDTPAAGTYCDAEILDCDGDGETDPGEANGSDGQHGWMRIVNAFGRYFNARFQTYGRYAHFWVYWTVADSAASRRGDAADNWERLKPFAVLLNLWHGGFVNEYMVAMAHRNVTVFGAFTPEPRSFFQQYAPKIWGFWPDVENWADAFVGYLCNKVAGSKVNNAGGGMAGQDRVYGLLSTRDPAYQNFQYMADLVEAGAAQCPTPIKFVMEKDFRRAGYWFNNQDGGEDRTEALDNMSQFQTAGVNTIIWPGGAETNHSAAAGKLRYFPEWIVAGEGDMDGRGFAGEQDEEAWAFAWVHSYQLREDNREASPGYQAYKEADPDGADIAWALTMYRDVFMFFSAVQVSGPRLTPSNVDAGFHAIQRRESSSPYTAACWFHPGDYSCVKDGHEAWWDGDGTTSNNSQGCYRMVREGTRYAADKWATARGAGIDAPGYTAAHGTGSSTPEPCNSYNGTGVAFQPAPDV